MLEFDHNVNINTHESVTITMYVDNLFIFAQDVKVFYWLKNIICNRFSMTNLKMEFILGLRVIKDRSQRSTMLG